MYKFDRDHQFKLSDFNQPIGLHMNPENRWVVKAAQIPWKEIELKYAKLFPGKKGMPAKPLRTALGSLIIQKQYGYSDRELVMQIRENPYYQFFIGLPGYQDADPFAPSLLVEFRKRLTEEILCDINEMIIAFNTPDDDPPGGPSIRPLSVKSCISAERFYIATDKYWCLLYFSSPRPSVPFLVIIFNTNYI